MKTTTTFWLGQQTTYDCIRGEAVALPERALPDSMVEWGVDAYEWRTATVQTVSAVMANERREMDFRTTRFCPDAGCSTFDDLVYDEVSRTVDVGELVHDVASGAWSSGPHALERGANGIEWEASFVVANGTSNGDDDACVVVHTESNEKKEVETTIDGGHIGSQRMRIRIRHDARRGMQMRPLEAVLQLERRATSAVALAEDYLAPELSRAPMMDARDLAIAAGFAGTPMPLLGDGAAVSMLPAGAFVAGCVDEDAGIAHICAGVRTGCTPDDIDDNASSLLCWNRSYHISTGELVEARVIALGAGKGGGDGIGMS